MFTRVRTLLADFFILAGRARARNSLLMLNDRLLEDVGVSRELLNKGVSAWPWRIEGKETTISSHAGKNINVYALDNGNEQKTQRAVSELADLVITRDHVDSAADNSRSEMDLDQDKNHPKAA